MQLASGDRLGPYEITAAIGEGGMGQVYKAKDTRLDRTVAIKILSPLLASDRQFRERFDREARLISQLDHPNICALYDIGQHDGTAYLVMQYLEGETLEDRLQRGAIAPDLAVPIAIQVADALARAHAAGIIHRDLKPANIMLTKSGARLLDFGLARASGGGVSTLTETQPARLTSQGTIIGTFHYMAPEQIEGAEGDARSDVWSFGCVLYEMLTGTRPFDGKTTASVLASILNAPAEPVRQRKPGVNHALDYVVARCLEKNPDARWQAVADIVHQLRWAATASDPVAVPARPPWNQPVAYAAALLLAAAAFAAAWLLKPAPPGRSVPLLKLAFVPPTDLTLTPFGSNGNPQFALSPDGLRIAYVAAKTGRAPALWVQRLDSRTAREIPGSTEAAGPFWSRDSQSVAFFSHGTLRRSGLESEQSDVLASTDATGGTWSGDVMLVASGFGPVMRLRASGGPLTPATSVEPGEGGHRWPQFLPDGKHFIYASARGGGARIAALDSSDATVLLESGSTPVVADATHILFVPPKPAKLQAQPIDVASRRLSGEPREILESVVYVIGSGFPPASVATTGLLAYWDGTTVGTTLRWYDRAGNVIAGLPAPDDAGTFALSPDDRRLAYVATQQEGGGVWVMELQTGIASRLTLSSAGLRPIWSPDGATLSLTTGGQTGVALLRRSVDGGGERLLGDVPMPDRATVAPGNFYANDWSRDGRTALVSVSQLDTGRDIVTFSADTGRTTPYVTARHAQVQPRFSPDERWVAYTSNETGPWEVFIESFPTPGVRHQVSYGGGSQPLWRRDGKELFYAAQDGRVMQMDVTPGDRWVPAKARVLFGSRMRPLFAPYPYNYDVSADGKRLLLKEVRPDTGPIISIVTDWRAR